MANSLVTVIEQLGENYEIYNTDVVVIDTDSNCLGIGIQDPGARLHIDNNTNKTNKIDVKINNLIINGISSEITCLHDSSYVSKPRLHILNELSSNNITINNINNDSIQFKDDKVIFNKDISLNPDNNLLISELSITRVNADAIASSQVNISSDDRLKHNEIDIKNALSTIRKLKPQKYQKTKQLLDYNYMGALNNEYTIEAGLIAQDINEIDELKFTVNEGTSSTPYKFCLLYTSQSPRDY